MEQHHDSGNVPLHFAVSFGPMRILKLLIENGASIDFKALDDANALTYAAIKRKWLKFSLKKAQM